MSIRIGISVLTLFLFGSTSSFADHHSDTNHFDRLANSSGMITSEKFDQILSNLKTYLPTLEECFDHDRLDGVVEIDNGLTQSLYSDVSAVFGKFIADGSCTGAGGETERNPSVVIQGLRSVGYSGKADTDECFNDVTVQKEEDALSAIISYINDGRCLLPTPSFFTAEYQKYFIDEENQSSTRDGFTSFLTQLGIGEMEVDDHAGHDHSGHDHGDHDDHSDHDHEDHSGHDHGDDDDHSDHDHGADHDDHDHGTDPDDHDGHDHTADDGHEDHDGHDHTTHGDHDDHDGHDHGADDGHDGHDHDDHDGHDHDGHDHSSESTTTSSDRSTTDHNHHHGHDHDRRRRSSHVEEEPGPRCYTGEQLMDIYGFGDVITDEQALGICPALIQQIQSKACSASDEHDSHHENGYTIAMIYGYGTASVAIISLLALLGLFLFPVLETKTYKMVMQFFIGLAIGTMAADALVHIIPQILGVHDHGAHDHGAHGHEEDMTFVWQMSVVCGGLYIVFAFENLLRAIKRMRSGNKDPNNGNTYENTPRVDGFDGEIGSSQPETSLNDISSEKSLSKEKSRSDDDIINQEDVLCLGCTSTLITVFIGDILHNFADGVAIGVAFALHWSTGVSTSIAILCHELPHEFGDFAIYLRNGASKWRAIGLNFAAACCAFIGLYAGINMATDEAVRRWLLSVIAGIFLYISLVQVMSVMLKEKVGHPLIQFLVQNLGMIVGYVIMLLIALYEGQIHI